MFKVLNNGEYKFYNKNNEISNSTNNKAIKSQLLENAKTQQGRNLIQELYREGASVGDGSTADAIRYQLSTGKMVGKKDHLRKGKERLKQIEKILLKDKNHPDKEILKFLANDLRQALGGN